MKFVAYRRLKWFAILAPTIFVAAVSYVALYPFVSVFESPPGFVALLLIEAAAIFVFAQLVFGLINRLESRVREQNRQLSALARIAGSVSDRTELSEFLRNALTDVLEVTGTDAGVICLLNEDTDELVAACHYGLSDEIAKQVERQKLGSDPVGTRAVRTGRPVVIEELLTNPDTAEMARREGYRSAISIPLKAESQVSGVLGIVSKKLSHFPPAEVELLTRIAAQLGLAVQNALLDAQTRQRNQELAALLAVGNAAASALDLHTVLEKALDAVVDVTSADAAEAWLLGKDGVLQLERRRGIPHTVSVERTRLPVGEGLPGLVAESGEFSITHDLLSGSALVSPALRQSDFQTYCLIPLRHRDETLGVLGVLAKDQEALTSSAELRLLNGIGEQIAMAIANARLYEQVLDVAVVEERERIARELHDGLAQVLGYINTQTLAVRKLLETGQTATAQDQLGVMQEATRGAYDDVREAIMALSNSLDKTGGLLPSLATYLNHYREMARVATQLEACPDLYGLQLPARTEVQVMRIIQEALSNCRKHAAARLVRVGLELDDGALLVEVTDDGVGFDAALPARPGWPRFGLQSMSERALAVGGSLEVRSRPGEGTRVICRVPVSGAEV